MFGLAYDNCSAGLFFPITVPGPIEIPLEFPFMAQARLI